MPNCELAIPMTMRDDRHLDESTLAGFLDRDLEPGARDRAIAHLDACPECRAELRSIHDLAASMPARARPRRRALWSVVGGVLAASLAGIIAIRQTQRTAVDDDTPRARAVVEGTGRIDVVTPGPASSGGPVTFTWRRAPVDTYHFSLLTVDGTLLSAVETTDTTLAWPSDVQAVPGAVYFWRVDGIAGTITATTGARRLRLAQ